MKDTSPTTIEFKVNGKKFTGTEYFSFSCRVTMRAVFFFWSSRSMDNGHVSHCEHNCVQWVDNPLSNNLVSEVSRPFSLLRVFLMIKCHPSMLIFVLILSPVTR